MSQRLISLSPDLQRLRNDGYDVAVIGGYLLIRDVPYVNEQRQVMLGVVACPLTLKSETEIGPQADHTVRFGGEYPCTADGVHYDKVVIGTVAEQVTPEILLTYNFSQKPTGGSYADYYDKITTYASILEHQAQLIDPNVKARTFPVVIDDDEDTVFKYMDTASSKAGINAITDKLRMDRVAIVGLGGTGSYVLDLVSKTPVGEIHLFDGDDLLQHNAFRMPGAVSTDELTRATTKVTFLVDRYSVLRDGIVGHDQYLSEDNVGDLAGMNFVFLAMTDGNIKRQAIEVMEASGVPFIDVGMGVEDVDGSLLGQLRVTTSTPELRDHIREGNRIPFSDGEEPNEYSSNIQIADLNALNASLAVIRWKKYCGFYVDLEHEHFSVYAIDGNHLLNEDTPQ